MMAFRVSSVPSPFAHSHQMNSDADGLWYGVLIKNVLGVRTKCGDTMAVGTAGLRMRTRTEAAMTPLLKRSG